MEHFTYSRASSVDQALNMIKTGGLGAKFLAGGTTMVDLMRLNVIQPTEVVDILSIPDLEKFDTSGKTELVFGALAKMSDVSADENLLRHYPVIAESLQRAASQQLRNMATLGGNLLQRTRCEYYRDRSFACNKRSPGSGCAAIDGLNRGHAIMGYSTSCIATYPGDFAVALAAFDALVDTVSPRGHRTVPLVGFHRVPGDTPNVETVLEHDELIVRIRVPRSPVGRASTYLKIRDRESYSFAVVSAAVALAILGGIVVDARIALGGVATVPWRATAAEKSLIGHQFTAARAQNAGEIAFSDAKPRQSSLFKMSLGPRTVAKALMIARDRAAL
jgi:xanthine dehydrogenase YagS FAD-binding subunit